MNMLISQLSGRNFLCSQISEVIEKCTYRITHIVMSHEIAMALQKSILLDLRINFFRPSTSIGLFMNHRSGGLDCGWLAMHMKNMIQW